MSSKHARRACVCWSYHIFEHVCTYIYMYVTHIYICIYVNMHIYTSIISHTCAYVDCGASSKHALRVCMYWSYYICERANAYIWMYVIYIYVCIYKYIYIYIYVHRLTHVCGPAIRMCKAERRPRTCVYKYMCIYMYGTIKYKNIYFSLRAHILMAGYYQKT